MVTARESSYKPLFSVFESAGLKQRKAVFILNSLVTGTNMTAVQSIIGNNGGCLKHVVVVTNCHPSVKTFSQYVEMRKYFD